MGSKVKVISYPMYIPSVEGYYSIVLPIRNPNSPMRQAKGTDQPLLVLEDDAAPTAEFPGCTLKVHGNGHISAFVNANFGGRNPSSKNWIHG